ncbi:MAG: hypothetical protein K2X48_00030 [Chitinophagaceae bacterium]|nr:hypothetical protein [Chitinophagaceae bacterium]
MKYKATLSNSAKILTFIVTILFAFSVFTSVWLFFMEGEAALLIIGILLFGIYVFVFLIRPLSYAISNGNIIIQKQAGQVVISKNEIESVAIIPKKDIDGAIRTFGVGGLFGYFGKFSNFRLGVMTWYVKRTDKLVLITTAQKKVVISPDEPEAFVAALH